MSNQQKCLIYCRVSSSKQANDGSGLKTQEFRCRQHAEAEGYEVVKVFQDQFSGGGDYNQRPGMRSLLEHLKDNKKQRYIVLFDDIKRLNRDPRYYLELKDTFESFGVKLECLNFKYEDDNPINDFQGDILMAMAKLERRQMAISSNQKQRARVEAGYHGFKAPVGYVMQPHKIHTKILVPKEPEAGVIREALEGFASGRFQTKQEVRRFLEDNPMYPKGKSGKIGNNKATDLLSDPLYAGYVEHKPWGITLREGHHEGLISWETFCQNQERLKGRSHAPARKDINKDFPLRGGVACSCGNALTSCYSKSQTGKLYPYYVCQNRKCEHKGKSVRKEKIEGEFLEILKSMTPTHNLFKAAQRMFKLQWNNREVALAKRQKLFQKELADLDSKIQQTVDRIVDATRPNVIGALEQRIDDMEREKLLIEEKLTRTSKPTKPFDEMYRTSMIFLKNPSKIWELGRFEEKRAVLKLAFSDRLIYDRKTGYRTPNFSLPFKRLGGFLMLENKMVPGTGLEPVQACAREILSLLCLPISPPGLGRWRRGSESNRRTRSCSPLHDHSATAPQRTCY